MDEISREELFLMKVKCGLDTFLELDKIFGELDQMIKNQPEIQSNIDKLLSDYNHLLENDDLTDTEIINIGKKIHEIRLIRNDENSASKLMTVYNQHKHKLQYSNRANRDMFFQAMKNARKTLHEDYKYRCLNEDDFKELKKQTKNDRQIVKKRRKYRKGITKEKIEKCLNKGMKTKEIAEYLGTHPTYISTLKRKFGFSKKD